MVTRGQGGRERTRKKGDKQRTRRSHAPTLRQLGQHAVLTRPRTNASTCALLHLCTFSLNSAAHQSPLALARDIVPTEDRDAVLLENRGSEFLGFGADDQTIAAVRTEQERIDVMDVDLGLEQNARHILELGFGL